MMDLHSRRGARAARPSSLNRLAFNRGKTNFYNAQFARLIAQESRVASGFKPRLKSEENV